MCTVCCSVDHCSDLSQPADQDGGRVIAGWESDILGRLVSPKLGDALGQQVIVENRAGASGIIGVDVVAKSAPDGYTLMLTQTSLAINAVMFPKMPDDALRDLALITEMVTTGSLLVVHRSIPAHSVRELIALAKAKPGELVIGSSGSGTQPHLAAEFFKIMAKVEMPQVLFKGAGHAVISLLTGRSRRAVSESAHGDRIRQKWQSPRARGHDIEAHAGDARLAHDRRSRAPGL
ncbi:MAG: tripartite tricarboxylate transporter substrate-binding protein [Burkholderiales bacterium]